MEGIHMWSGKGLNRFWFSVVFEEAFSNKLSTGLQMIDVAKVTLSELISNLDQIRTTGGLITRWLCKSHVKSSIGPYSVARGKPSAQPFLWRVNAGIAERKRILKLIFHSQNIP